MEIYFYLLILANSFCCFQLIGIEKKIKKDEAVDEEGKEAFIKKFKAMLEKSSQYTELVDQKDAESQENYFQKLEKKEFLEEKMLSVFQMPCKAVKCLTVYIRKLFRF